MVSLIGRCCCLIGFQIVTKILTRLPECESLVQKSILTVLVARWMGQRLDIAGHYGVQVPDDGLSVGGIPQVCISLR